MKSDEELIKLLKPFTPRDNKELMAQIVPLIKERITTLAEFSQLAGFFFTRPKVDLALFEKLDYRHYLKSAAGTLQSIEVWQKGTITGALMHLIDKNHWQVGDFFMTLRIALAGSRFTPPINDSIIILGRKETLARIKMLF